LSNKTAAPRRQKQLVTEAPLNEIFLYLRGAQKAEYSDEILKNFVAINKYQTGETMQ